MGYDNSADGFIFKTDATISDEKVVLEQMLILRVGQ